MITLVIKDEDLRREMKRLRKVGREWKIVLGAFGAHMLGSTSDVFRQEGKPEKWKPLKDETIIARFTRGNRARKRKKRVGSPAGKRAIAGAKILFDRGRLAGSMGFRVRKNVLEFGTNLVYAATHQFGDKKRKIPARPYLIFLDENIKKFEEIIVSWLVRGKI